MKCDFCGKFLPLAHLLFKCRLTKFFCKKNFAPRKISQNLLLAALKGYLEWACLSETRMEMRFSASTIIITTPLKKSKSRPHPHMRCKSMFITNTLKVTVKNTSYTYSTINNIFPCVSKKARSFQIPLRFFYPFFTYA